MRNIKLKQYIKSKDAAVYDAVLSHIKPANSFSGYSMNVNKMPYINVKYCIRKLSSIQTWEDVQEIFQLCFFEGVDDARAKRLFWNAGILEYFSAKNYLVKAISDVVDKEVKLLESISTDEHLWKMAGADKLKPHNDTLPLLQLGKLYGIYPYDLGKKPYGEVLSLLVQNKVQNEVEQEYQKLKFK